MKINIVKRNDNFILTTNELKILEKGLLVQVHDGCASIMVKNLTSGSMIGTAFWEFNSFKNILNTWTNPYDAFIDRLPVNNCEYYLFNSLQDFCNEAIKNNWRWE